MSSYARIWLHMVFGTKYNKPMIKTESEKLIYDFMQEKLKELDCIPMRINGMPDHVHLLFLANYKLSSAEIAMRVKGSCSHWINKNNILPEKFEWKEGIGVFSVSDALVSRTKRYIDLQKRHHSKFTFQQECDQLFKEHEQTIRNNSEE